MINMDGEGSSKNTLDPNNPLMFPCKICGDKSSGVHYGVLSCEGCKGFYRRTIRQKMKYAGCVFNGECKLTRETRTRCQECRFKRCIEKGMSKNSIKYGRIPKREKAKIIAERIAAIEKSQGKDNHATSSMDLSFDPTDLNLIKDDKNIPSVSPSYETNRHKAQSLSPTSVSNQNFFNISRLAQNASPHSPNDRLSVIKSTENDTMSPMDLSQNSVQYFTRFHLQNRPDFVFPPTTMLTTPSTENMFSSNINNLLRYRYNALFQQQLLANPTSQFFLNIPLFTTQNSFIPRSSLSTSNQATACAPSSIMQSAITKSKENI